MPALRRIVVLSALAALVAIPSSLPALARSGTATSIVHRQSVLTELSPSGEVETSRIITQLTVEGDGPVEVALPAQSTSGLRNLEGFGRPAVDGDTVVWDVDATPDGAQRRSVADNTADHPMSIGVTYSLDGEPIEPDAVVGRSGVLTVTLDIENVTAQEQDVVVYDGQGRPTTEPMQVAVPIVGSVTATLDDRFLVTDAPGAKIVGDGRGNTVVDWLLVMFSPIGSEQQTVSYTAQVTDAVVAPVAATFVPVHAGSFPSLRTSQASYTAAKDGLGELTNGALIVDGNVKLLGAGAADLLAGLVQLRDGAEQLNDGLAGTAAPGARTLSDGMSQARSGGRELADGLGDLRSGAGRLSDGLTTARSGGGRLASGLRDLDSGATRLSDGLTTARSGGGRLANGLRDLDDGAGRLSDGAGQLAFGADQLNTSTGELVDGSAQLATGAAGLLQGLQDFKDGINAPAGLPSAIAGVVQIRVGVGRLIQGIGAEDTAGTLLNGIAQLREGLKDVSGGGTAIAGGAQQLQLGVGKIPGCDPATLVDADPDNDTACGVQDLIDWVRADMGGLGIHPLYAGLLTGASSGIGDVATPQTILNGLEGLRLGGLGIQNGIDETGDLSQPTILNGLRRLQFGLDNPAAFSGAGPGTVPNPSCLQPGDPGHEAGMLPCGLRQGLQLVDGGLDQLETGLTDALAGINAALGSTADAPTASLIGAANALANGSAAISEGAQQLQQLGTAPLATGADDLAGGAALLAAGAATAASGAGDLAGGLLQLDDGAGQLADGAGTAASGARDLSNGLIQLDDGAGELASGAGRAATGANDLANGLVQLDDGAERLANGLVDAADGSGQIAEGLVSAADGGEQIADGTVALSEQGMGAIIDGASAGAAGPSRLLELANAANARGRANEALPYGTVAGADASAVFRYDIATVGTTPDDGPPMPMRAGAAVLAFALAGALGFGLRRRFVA